MLLWHPFYSLHMLPSYIGFMKRLIFLKSTVYLLLDLLLAKLLQVIIPCHFFILHMLKLFSISNV